MHQYYDYCDTYDSYDSGLALDGKNSVKTFSCELCKQSKFILKKSVNDPKFKCEECIQKKEAVTTSNPNDVALNMPATPTLSFQASPAMLTADGMYQPYQQYQPYQLEQQQQQQQEQGQQQPALETTPQFSWRWFNFFV
jgi:hypothetical protein